MTKSDADPTGIPVHEYLARVPSDQEWARREAARYRGLSTDERFGALESLLRLMQDLLGARAPGRDGALPFWRHWSDPTLGRPR